MSKLKILFMGTPDFSVNILQGLIDNYDVVGVVTQPDKEVGRHKEIKFPPVKELALKNDIRVFQPVNIRDDYSDILGLNPDIIVTCAYGQIIPKEILDAPRLGCINVHGSLLPKLRGGAPIHHAIMDGLEETGITIMYMDVSMDSGDIISQRSIPITDNDNVGILWDKLSLLGRDLLIDTLPSIIDGTNDRIKQDESLVTFGFNVKREEEHVDFNKSTREVFNHVRGLNPWPSAYAILDENEMKIYECDMLEKEFSTKACGEIVDINKEGIVVKTNDGAVVLKTIKPFGKKMMNAKDYVNGVGKDNLIGKVLK